MHTDKNRSFYIKRIADLFFTLLFLLVTWPFIILIAFFVRLFIGRPVLFRQERPGLNGIPFYLFKFRSMNESTDENGKHLSDAERLTRLGKFLRNYSLDELPELINVIKGEMSWVGPRPLLMQYLSRYSQEQARRHEVLPGITGWAQINGRNALTWQEKFRMDVWYVDNWSIILDLKILWMTVWKVLKREGINQPGYTTAQEFMGDEEIS